MQTIISMILSITLLLGTPTHVILCDYEDRPNNCNYIICGQVMFVYDEEFGGYISYEEPTSAIAYNGGAYMSTKYRNYEVKLTNPEERGNCVVYEFGYYYDNGKNKKKSTFVESCKQEIRRDFRKAVKSCTN